MQDAASHFTEPNYCSFLLAWCWVGMSPETAPSCPMTLDKSSCTKSQARAWNEGKSIHLHPNVLAFQHLHEALNVFCSLLQAFCLCLYLHFVCLYLHSISECCACCCVTVFMKIIKVIHYLSLWITKNVFTLHYIITQIDAREMFVTICPVKTCFFMFVTCGTRQFKKPVVSSFATSLCLCVPVCLCVCFLSSSSFFILKIKKKKILLHTLGASLWIFQNRKINTLKDWLLNVCRRIFFNSFPLNGRLILFIGNKMSAKYPSLKEP